MEALLEKETAALEAEPGDGSAPWTERIVARSGEWLFYIAEEGIRARSDGGDIDVLASSARIEAVEKLVNPETGAAWVRVRAASETGPRDLLCPAAKGAAGVVRKLQEMGEFVRPKLAAMYVEEVLANSWKSLPVRDVEKEDLADISLDAACVYELFLEFVRDNAEGMFDTEAWGKIRPAENGKKEAVVTRPAMNAFFRQAGIPEEQRAAILRYWREQGWLKTDEQEKRFTKKETVKGVRRRVFVVELPKPSENGEEAVAERTAMT